jgi:L-ascorbate metabolism protein UlaG (beta-lactamase superfamily)
MGRYDDRATRPMRGPRDLFRWRVLDPLAGRRPKIAKEAARFVTPFRKNDGAALRRPEPSLTWIGHATFVAKLGGQLVATDPVFCERISGVVPRRAPVGVELEALPPVDVVTISHNHRDHLDLPTIARLGSRPLYVVPMGNAGYLRDAGATRIVELDWWDSIEVGQLTVTLVPARHWSMRAPWDRNEALWGGFVIRGPEGALYHAGDTALFDGFAEIGRRAGPIDWALLPIGSYEPRWFMEPQHMNPEDAMDAFRQLGARIFVAMHWGTFKLTDEPLSEPPARLRELAAKAGLPDERVWILDVGETRRL